jgi:hypothetical protein
MQNNNRETWGSYPQYQSMTLVRKGDMFKAPEPIIDEPLLLGLKAHHGNLDAPVRRCSLTPAPKG